MNDIFTNQLLQSIACGLLNSLWQMAFLWIVYQLISILFRPSINAKYYLLVGFQGLGLLSFFYTIYQSFNSTQFNFFQINNNILNINYSNKIYSIIGIFYLLFVLVLLLKLLLQLFANASTTAKLEVYKNDKWNNFISDVAAKFSIPKKVIIKTTLDNIVPYTIGFIKPIIVLPIAALNNLSVQELEAILIHEMAHIKRRDFFINVLLIVVENILCFNPFSKMFNKEIDKLREMCCDEMVVHYPYSSVQYSNALLTIAKNQNLQNLWQTSLAAVGNNFLLKKRIERMLFGVSYKEEKINKFQLSIVLVFGLFIFSLVGFIHVNVERILVSDTPNENVFFANKSIEPNKINIAKNVAYIEPKTTASIAENNILKHKSANKKTEHKSTLNILQLKQDLMSMDLKELANNITNAGEANEEIKAVQANNADSSTNNVQLLTTVNKDDETKVEKYLMPATTESPATTIVITTTTNKQGKKQVKIEIEKINSRID